MVSLDTADLTAVHWLAILAAVYTGVVHLFLGASGAVNPDIGPAMAVAFLAAGAGFLAAVALVLADYRRRLVYLVGIPFTAVQIPLWYLVNYDSPAEVLAEPSFVGLSDKVAQVVLLALLVVLLARGRE